MNYFRTLLALEARKAGRAVRSAQFRHRRMTERPLGFLLWQLGAEPFTAAAVGWGFGPAERQIVVPGEPRDRVLAFRELTKVACSFNSWFEGAGDRGEPPQIVVPNIGNLRLLGRLGRRLAYLPIDGDHPADPELVRFGRHLVFLGERSRFPGQQLVLVVTDLLATHWVGELSDLEMQNLPALNAIIEPPAGVGAHAAAFAEEMTEIGPLPSATEDNVVDGLLEEFNTRRQRSTDETVVAPLRGPIEAHYARLVDRGWSLMWRCLDRERAWPEAPSVERRWTEDVEALEWHLEFTLGKGGRYRTRYTHARAARTLRNWEEAERLVIAEEAIDDPLRMAPSLLANDAIAGRVISIDLDHRERANIRSVRRPIVVVETDEPVLMPVEKELYWTGTPKGAAYTILAVQASATGSLVTLRHETGSNVDRPAPGNRVVFSIHHTHPAPPLMLPRTAPWTHQAPPATEPADIESPEETV